MAPLRSSRATRNHEHNQPVRNRAGFVDYDPTDGLPVRKWQRETVKINQDLSTDPVDIHNNAAKNIESDLAFPELEPPSFITQLPQHSQELLRRARMPDTNVKPRVWDNKRGEWITSQEVESQRGKLKSKHLMNVDVDDNENDEDDDDDVSGDDEDGVPAGVVPSKKRKIAGGLLERTFEAKKWVSVPIEKADTIPEPKYLADRRAGMPSLYTSAYKNTSGYGAITVNGPDSYGISTNTAGFDLGDGSGLGTALGGNAAEQGTPVRKNMPPRRKKKKLGGPGRKKAAQTTEQTGDVEMGGMARENGVQGEQQSGENLADGHKHDGEEDGEDGSGSESEEEGSEEGEIEENRPAESTTAVNNAAATTNSGTATAEEAAPPPPAIQPPTIDEPETTKTEEATARAPAHAPVSPVINEPTTEASEIVAPEVVAEPAAPTPPPPAEEYVSTEQAPVVEEPATATAAAATRTTTIDEVPVPEIEETNAEEVDLLGDLEAAVEGMEKAE